MPGRACLTPRQELPLLSLAPVFHASTPTCHRNGSDVTRCLGRRVHASAVPIPRRYVSIKYTERLAGIEPSVGSIGDPYNNALAENINGLYKAKVIHRRGPWRTFEAVESARTVHRRHFRRETARA